LSWRSRCSPSLHLVAMAQHRPGLYLSSPNVEGPSHRSRLGRHVAHSYGRCYGTVVGDANPVSALQGNRHFLDVGADHAPVWKRLCAPLSLLVISGVTWVTSLLIEYRVKDGPLVGGATPPCSAAAGHYRRLAVQLRSLSVTAAAMPSPRSTRSHPSAGIHCASRPVTAPLLLSPPRCDFVRHRPRSRHDHVETPRFPLRVDRAVPSAPSCCSPSTHLLWKRYASVKFYIIPGSGRRRARTDGLLVVSQNWVNAVLTRVYAGQSGAKPA
jgi:hypothetical protein